MLILNLLIKVKNVSFLYESFKHRSMADSHMNFPSFVPVLRIEIKVEFLPLIIIAISFRIGK